MNKKEVNDFFTPNLDQTKLKEFSNYKQSFSNSNFKESEREEAKEESESKNMTHGSRNKQNRQKS